MTKKTSTPTAVELAKQAKEIKLAELMAARQAVARLVAEHDLACEAIRDAQEESDASLPQCDRVQLNWRSDKVTSKIRVVILRRTAGGSIVVRRFGDSSSDGDRYKWSPTNKKFVRAARSSSFIRDRYELRGVPPEYLPPI